MSAFSRYIGIDYSGKRLGAARWLAAIGAVVVDFLGGTALLWPIDRQSGVVDAIGVLVIGVASFLFHRWRNRDDMRHSMS